MVDSAEEFVALLKEASGLDATIDRPDDPLGESFIDVSGRGVETQISYRPGTGFGFFTDSDAFGQRPDILIKDPAAAVKHLVDQTYKDAPDDLNWKDVAAAMAAKVPDFVPAESLKKFLENLDQLGSVSAEIPGKLAKAIASMSALETVPPPSWELSQDIEQTFLAARSKLVELDPQGAFALLDAKLAAFADVQQDAIRRKVALLVERARAQRLSFDHAGVLATLQEITRLDPANDLALVETGDVHVVVGSLTLARVAFEKALAIADASGDPSRIALAHDRIGDVCWAEGDRVGALAAYESSLDLAESLARRDPGNSSWKRDLSVSHTKIGDIRLEEGDRAGALAAYETGLAIREALTRSDPSNSIWQRDLSLSHTKIGDIRLEEGDRARALAAYEMGLAIHEALARRDPSNSRWQRDLFVLHVKIGDVRLDEGDRAGALVAYESGLAVAEVLARNAPSNTRWLRHLSSHYLRLAEFDSDAPANWQKMVEVFEAMVSAGRFAH